MRYTGLLAILTVSLLTACGFGYRYNYGASELYPAASGGGSVGLAVMDVRPDVLSGKLGADWVGSKQGGGGDGSEVRTRSGNGLAEDLQAVITEGLSGNGFAVTPVAVTLQDLEQVGDSINRSGAQRNVLLRIYQWQTRTVSEMVLDYRLALEVFDDSGQRLVLKQLEGSHERLGQTPLESAESALAATVMSAKLNELFNDPRVIDALGRG